MLLSCHEVDKTFIDQHLLDHVSFHINENDKAALVGINGSGKTTLLRIIMGELSPDSGTVTLPKDTATGYLPQNALINSTRSIYDELLSVQEKFVSMEEKLHQLELKMNTVTGDELNRTIEEYTALSERFEQNGGLLYRSEITGILMGLGFQKDEFTKSVDTLSGGQKTRVALGKLLITKPEFIILDEPTNHLDLSSIMWLENYLLNYKGTVLIVSHDRYFLDKIVNRVFELENGKLTTFKGNYTDYATKKEIIRIAEQNAYKNNQREIKHQEEVIKKLRSYNREKSIKRAESRVKMLDKMEKVEKPSDEQENMHITLIPRFDSGNDVLQIMNLSKSFDGHTLFSGLNMDIKKGEHVAVIGDNGIGKSTLLKIINHMMDADEGTVRIGTNVLIGYYDQEHQILHGGKTIFEEISDDYPVLTNTEIRNVLAAFLFTGDEVQKKISSLSGGEKGRVMLAKIMLSGANFLILDEPTNHLDIISKEILEDALNSYTGTVLYVSHDRYFINRTASRIMDLTTHGFYNYLGNYDYYLEKKVETDSRYEMEKSISSDGKILSRSSADKDTSGKTDWKNQKEQQAALRKIENEILKVEKEIDRLETRDVECETLMCSEQYCNNSLKLNEFMTERNEIKEKLDKLYERWEELNLRKEEI